MSSPDLPTQRSLILPSQLSPLLTTFPTPHNSHSSHLISNCTRSSVLQGTPGLPQNRHPLTSPILSSLECSCLSPQYTSDTPPSILFSLAVSGPLELLLVSVTPPPRPPPTTNAPPPPPPLHPHTPSPTLLPNSPSSPESPSTHQEFYFTPQNSPSSAPPKNSTIPPLSPVPHNSRTVHPLAGTPFHCPQNTPALTCSAPLGLTLPATQ